MLVHFLDLYFDAVYMYCLATWCLCTLVLSYFHTFKVYFLTSLWNVHRNALCLWRSPHFFLRMLLSFSYPLPLLSQNFRIKLVFYFTAPLLFCEESQWIWIVWVRSNTNIFSSLDVLLLTSRRLVAGINAPVGITKWKSGVTCSAY